jgi:DNA modification methylase
MPYRLIHADCFEWLQEQAENEFHAVITDPPFGVIEFTEAEKAKLRKGKGGVWRIPPKLGGCQRAPLPRFTDLGDTHLTALSQYFRDWGELVLRTLRPGGHVFIAATSYLSHFVFGALVEAGFEKRAEIIRLVQTLRGGDRPKNAHLEFPDVTVMPRSCYEPWGLFRKPCEGRVQDNLRQWQTGGLRRVSEQRPFCDVIPSERTPQAERDIAPHPSLKPQSFLRQLAYSALPLGEGVIVDPFCGSGSTIAAAAAVGYDAVGVESDDEFFNMAQRAIPRLAVLHSNGAAHLGNQAVIAQPDLFGDVLAPVVLAG